MADSPVPPPQPQMPPHSEQAAGWGIFVGGGVGVASSVTERNVALNINDGASDTLLFRAHGDESDADGAFAGVESTVDDGPVVDSSNPWSASSSAVSPRLRASIQYSGPPMPLMDALRALMDALRTLDPRVSEVRSGIPGRRRC